MWEHARKVFEQTLAAFLIVLMVSLVMIVALGVFCRKIGFSLSWYDEVASVLLAWLSYYGAAFAALKRSHIGFPGILNRMPSRMRIPIFITGEAFVFSFFALLAWLGVYVLHVLKGDALISLPWIPTQLTQSVIPIGAVLFIIGEVLSLPDAWRRARTSLGVEEPEEVAI